MIYASKLKTIRFYLNNAVDVHYSICFLSARIVPCGGHDTIETSKAMIKFGSFLTSTVNFTVSYSQPLISDS